MSELSKTQKLQAQRDALDKAIVEQTNLDQNAVDDTQEFEGLTEEAATRIVGADRFMRAVAVHIVRTSDALKNINTRLDDMNTNGFRMCEGHRVEIANLKASDEKQWTAIGKANRTPRQKTMAWGAGGVGIGGAVIVVLDWISKHWGGNTP